MNDDCLGFAITDAVGHGTSAVLLAVTAMAKGPSAVGYGAGRIPPNGVEFDKLEAFFDYDMTALVAVLYALSIKLIATILAVMAAGQAVVVITRNIDATTTGGELSLAYATVCGWRAEGSLAYVRAEEALAARVQQLRSLEGERAALEQEWVQWSSYAGLAIHGLDQGAANPAE